MLLLYIALTLTGTVDNPPIKLPIGVLTAETITTLLFMIFIILVYLANLIILKQILIFI
jgi:uncharacterized membrane protein YraQ (UPF0718 family)